MKLMNFTMVNVIVDREAHTMNVQRVENVPVNVEQLFLVVPEMIPSSITGPQGQPVGKLATKLVSSGGAAITVDGAPKQILERIKTTYGIEVAEEPKRAETTNDPGPKTVKLVVPGRVETEANETPAEE